MQENDELVMLNGQPLSNVLTLDFHDVGSAAITSTASAMRLTLLRGGKAVIKQCVRSNDLDKTTYLPLGIRFLPLNEGWPFIVSAVLGGSMAAKVGVKAGDLVTGANGHMFEKDSWAAVQSLLTPKPGKRFILEVGQRQEATLPEMHWAKSKHLIINP